MKLKKFLIHFMILLIIGSIYVIPVGIGINNTSFDSLNSIKYNLFAKLRIVFILAAGMLFVIDTKKKKSTYLFLSIIVFFFIFKYLLYNELDFGLFYIIASLIVYDYLLNNQLNQDLIKKICNIAFYFYLLQIIIFSIIFFERYSIFKITASFNDANYTAYFGLCLAYYFYSNNNKVKSYILFTVLLFTFSRLYIITFILLFILNKVLNKKIRRQNIQYNLIFYVFVQIVVIGISKYYVNLFETIKPEYIYLEGFERIKGMFDHSNYIRFKANLLAVSSISFLSFFLGLEKNSFTGLYLFSNKSIFPHNTLWSLYIQYGLLVSGIFISRFVKIFKVSEGVFLEYYLVLLMYHSFLGLSSFYGFDLLLQLIFIRSISLKKRGECNV